MKLLVGNKFKSTCKGTFDAKLDFVGGTDKMHGYQEKITSIGRKYKIGTSGIGRCSGEL
jgi:hypothetical protein